MLLPRGEQSHGNDDVKVLWVGWRSSAGCLGDVVKTKGRLARGWRRGHVGERGISFCRNRKPDLSLSFGSPEDGRRNVEPMMQQGHGEQEGVVLVSSEQTACDCRRARKRRRDTAVGAEPRRGGGRGSTVVVVVAVAVAVAAVAVGGW